MKLLEKISSIYSQFAEVDAILLSGSQVNDTCDKYSDYDIYIYINQELYLEKRKMAASLYSDYMEINNCFWEPEDDGFIGSVNASVDIIYRNISEIESQINKILFEYDAKVGYSTCIWSNFIQSKILFDRNGRVAQLQDKYRITYPRQLKDNIIKKNYPVLRTSMASYYYQIDKALKRNDTISVQHRTAALLASYFDILFALNEIPHPGEKKIIKILKNRAVKLPEEFEIDIEHILQDSAFCERTLLKNIDRLLNNLDVLLEQENIIEYKNDESRLAYSA